MLTPCGFDIISCGPLERQEQNDQLWLNRRIAERKMYIPDKYRVQARTNAEELREIVAVLAEKLNKAQGPVIFLIPTQGWSVLSGKGEPLYEPETNAVFAPYLRERLKPAIVVEEVDAHINSRMFASAVVDALDKMITR